MGVRVIAGTAKGHRLEAPPGKGTRPTSDRVREALFSSLQPRLRRAHVIDLYAGSGALGIEALSRGAEVATFVEKATWVQRVIRQNLDHTGFAGRADVLVRDVRQALREGPPGVPFDVALLDPPYATDRHELEEVLELLVPLLAPDAIVVLERPTRASAPTWPPGLNPGRVRRYGDTALHEASPATPPVERNDL